MKSFELAIEICMWIKPNKHKNIVIFFVMCNLESLRKKFCQISENTLSVETKFFGRPKGPRTRGQTVYQKGVGSVDKQNKNKKIAPAAKYLNTPFFMRSFSLRIILFWKKILRFLITNSVAAVSRPPTTDHRMILALLRPLCTIRVNYSNVRGRCGLVPHGERKCKE